MRTVNPFALSLLLGCVLLVACGESSTDPEGDETGHPPAAMVGLWLFESATQNGVAVSLADALEWRAGTVAARLNIQANGGYQYEEVDVSGAQIWSEFGWMFVDQEGGTIELNVQGDSDGVQSDQVDLDYTLVGDALTLELAEGGSTFVFTLGM